MIYKPGGAYYREFVTCNPATGAALNADSTPVATANHNGTDDGTFTLTVTNLDTGRYKVTGTIPSGYAAGDVVGVSVSATVSAITGKAVVDTFGIDTKRFADLNDLAATAIVSGGAITTSSGKVAATIASGDGADAASIKTTIGVAGAGLTAVTTSLGTHAPAGWINQASLDSALVVPANVTEVNGTAATVGAIPPTAAQNAAAILATPAYLLATDASGRVILQPTQTGVTIPTVTTVGSVTGAVGSVTSPSDSPGVTSLLATTATITGLYATGTVSSVTSGAMFTVHFPTPVNAAVMKGLSLCFGSSDLMVGKLTITTAAQVDSTHIAFAFSSAFSPAPTIGDSVMVI